MIDLRKEKDELIEMIECDACYSANVLIALLELKKYELCKKLYDEVD